MRHFQAETNGIRLHCVESGAGQPVLCLHGFPDFWYTWRLLLPELAAAGWRAVAPDLRGYGESSRPREREAYATRELLADVAGLIEQLGGEVVLVGHDWGGVLAWQLAARRPELVRRLVVLNAPHPAAYRKAMRRSLQLLRSWYIAFFQLPRLPELLLTSFDGALLDRVLRKEAQRRGRLVPEDLARYRAAFRERDAVRAGIDWYRNIPRRRGSPAAGRAGEAEVAGRVERTGRIEVPTLVVWGERDPHLDRANLDLLPALVPELRIERIADAGHWVHLDAPERVNRAIVEFIAGE